jgi:hypothetical protein
VEKDSKRGRDTIRSNLGEGQSMNECGFMRYVRKRGSGRKGANPFFFSLTKWHLSRRANFYHARHDGFSYNFGEKPVMHKKHHIRSLKLIP